MCVDDCVGMFTWPAVFSSHG